MVCVEKKSGDDLPPGAGDSPLVDWSPRLIKVEANLLRLPLFALGTKGLKRLDGILCTGKVTRDDGVHQFTFRASRNTAASYPGPLSRSVHLAFLSMVSEAGLPFHNPLTWSWYDLCRRMRVSCSGQMIRHLKDAIRSTAAVFLWSEYALHDKASGAQLFTQNDGLHLYDRVAFAGTPLPDGTVADTNAVHFSEWYLSNLNAFFTAPLDYHLWRALEVRSSIASRLYEFLLVNFYAEVPVLRINYDTLVRFLPLRCERYRSQAEHQLGTALGLIQAAGIVERTEWTDAKRAIGQLQFHRGRLLQRTAARPDPASPMAQLDLLSDLQVKEIRSAQSADWSLAAEFYRLLSGHPQRPSVRDLALARELLSRHGQATMKELLPSIVTQLRDEWPDAKTFSALERFLPAALEQQQHARAKAERHLAVAKQRAQEQDAAIKTAKAHADLALQWNALDDAQQEAIRSAVLATQPASLRKFPKLLDRLCVEELGRRLAA